MLEEMSYKVYIQTDAENRITSINSSLFLENTEGWLEIDEGTGERYGHAQTQYLAKALETKDGFFCYKLVDGQVVERSEEEIQKDRDTVPPAPPTQQERIEALEAAILSMMGV